MTWLEAQRSIPLEHHLAVNPPSAFAIHTYPKSKGCVVSSNIKEVMSDVLVGTQKAVDSDLRRTTLADVVSKIRRQVSLAKKS